MSVRSASSAGAGYRNDWIIPSTASTYNTALTAESAKAPTATRPTTDTATGRYVFGDAEIVDRVLVQVGFILTDAADETASASVWGWQQTATGFWLPKLLATLAVTAGTRTGVSGGEVTNTDFFADTITASVDHTVREVKSWTATNGIAYAEIDAMNSDLIEVEVTRNSGTSASVKPFLRGM